MSDAEECQNCGSTTRIVGHGLCCHFFNCIVAQNHWCDEWNQKTNDPAGVPAPAGSNSAPATGEGEQR